jgi:single-stranded DNA-binding protein
VHIEGRLRSYTVESKDDGAKRTKLEVEARRVQILEKTSSGAAGGESEAPSVGADTEEVPF